MHEHAGVFLPYRAGLQLVGQVLHLVLLTKKAELEQGSSTGCRWDRGRSRVRGRGRGRDGAAARGRSC